MWSSHGLKSRNHFREQAGTQIFRLVIEDPIVGVFLSAENTALATDPDVKLPV